MPRKQDILFLSDAPGGPVGVDLDILYPGRVAKLDFTKDAHGIDVLAGFKHVITLVSWGVNLPKLDYRAVRRFARSGGQVVSCLLEYARDRKLHFSKTHVGDRVRPAMRIEVEDDVTRGYSVGDTIGWFGTVSSAPDTSYENQMLQRQVMGVSESEKVSILATSTLNGGAVMVEEQVGKGRILALDLLSPIRPFFNSHGSTNKYLFIGNLIGGSVRYGKHYPERLSYDDFVQAMHALADQHPDLTLTPEGPCSDGREMWSFGIGDESAPTIYAGGAIHGWEWENAFGLLRLTELLCQDPKFDGWDASRLHFRIVPIQNPYGYDHFVRQNARGVDLNRNFDAGWDELAEVQDVVTPWDYNYKGARPASERETQVVQAIIDRDAPRCAMDFHTADYVMLLPYKGDEKLLMGVHRAIGRRLADRYICQRPYGGPYQQVNMDETMDHDAPLPYLIDYAAGQGCPAAFLIEMSGNRDETHALVMNTDTVVEICMAAARQCVRWKPQSG